MSAKNEVPTNTELLKLPAASRLLGMSIWQLRGLIARRAIPVVHVGRTFFVRRATLLRWAERAEAPVRG